MTMWLSVDPMADKYPSISPYAYCAWNPVKLVDPDGREMTTDPYLIYNGKTHQLEIWDDNQTANDYSDDVFLGSYDAHNEVASYSKGKWPDGKYDMEDTKKSYTHGQATDKKGIKLDSKDGSYGEGGIFRAKNFKQDNGMLREGMGIHSGRGFITNFFERVTMGCIRTTDDAIDGINDAIANYGPLQFIIVKNNSSSNQSQTVGVITPGVSDSSPTSYSSFPILNLYCPAGNTYVASSVRIN